MRFEVRNGLGYMQEVSEGGGSSGVSVPEGTAEQVGAAASEVVKESIVCDDMEEGAGALGTAWLGLINNAELGEANPVVSVSAPSAAGKGYAIEQAVKRLEASEEFKNGCFEIEVISLDDYYRALEDMSTLEDPTNFDCPEALKLELAAKDISKLSKGEEASIPLHTFTEKSENDREYRSINGLPEGKKRLIVVDGLFATDKHFPDLFNHKTTISIDTHTQAARRVHRDLKRRQDLSHQDIVRFYLGTAVENQGDLNSTDNYGFDLVIKNKLTPEEINKYPLLSHQKKFMIEDEVVGALENKLTQMGGIKLGKKDQIDGYYSLGEEQEDGQLARIRRTSNQEYSLSFKGPEDENGARKLLEVSLADDEKSFDEIKVNLAKVYPKDKKYKDVMKSRTTYQLPGDITVHIDNVLVDNVPLGCFVEVCTFYDKSKDRQIPKPIYSPVEEGHKPEALPNGAEVRLNEFLKSIFEEEDLGVPVGSYVDMTAESLNSVSLAKLKNN